MGINSAHGKQDNKKIGPPRVEGGSGGGVGEGVGAEEGAWPRGPEASLTEPSGRRTVPSASRIIPLGPGGGMRHTNRHSVEKIQCDNFTNKTRI